jgi:hypothetical protein
MPMPVARRSSVTPVGREGVTGVGPTRADPHTLATITDQGNYEADRAFAEQSYDTGLNLTEGSADYVRNYSNPFLNQILDGSALSSPFAQNFRTNARTLAASGLNDANSAIGQTLGARGIRGGNTEAALRARAMQDAAGQRIQSEADLSQMILSNFLSAGTGLAGAQIPAVTSSAASGQNFINNFSLPTYDYSQDVLDSETRDLFNQMAQLEISAAESAADPYQNLRDSWFGWLTPTVEATDELLSSPTFQTVTDLSLFGLR